MIEKICTNCKTKKPIIEFLKRGNHRLKTCEVCYKERQNLRDKIRYATEPDFKSKKIMGQRKARWKSKYGVSVEEVYKTLEDQQNICANETCDAVISLDIFADPSSRAHIDHNHSTGKFRSLLCNRCNMLLGHIEINKHIIDSLVKYRDKFNHLHNKDNIP